MTHHQEEQNAPDMATSPEDEGARLARESVRRIYEFDVYELPDGRWRAIHKRDRALRLEHADWQELYMACVSARIAHDLKRAFAEQERQSEQMRQSWRGDGPGGCVGA